MIGNSISYYNILEKLGAGGMGEVYKAQDTKLDRFVALKFLPAQFSSTEDEKKRFIKEAKTASSLNHSNICTIYDIQEYENQKGERQSFIVMEYVEGETLRNLNKDLSVKDIIDIGIQIAEGLSAAHEKGIIHRDIKPENIMVRRSGRVQIMDFGLAKLYLTSEVSRLTKAGTTMGTLSYMSPEQVQGLEVDYRSDIFSAGVVLYELLSGESPFKGIHDAAIIYKIVNADVLPISSIRKDIDPLLDLIILKCLEKDKEKRYQSSKELAEDLKSIKQIYEGEDVKLKGRAKRKLFSRVKSKRTTSISPSGSIRLERRSVLFSKKLLWVYSIIIGIIGVIVYYSFFNAQSLQINPNMKTYEIALPYTKILYPSMSSDGNWIAFPVGDQNNKWDIYLMHTSMKEPRRITYDSTHVIIPYISPDGSQILYMIKDEIQIISSLGGVRKKITENHVDVAAKWSPDGISIGFIRSYYPDNKSTSFWIMNPDGTNAHPVFAEKIVPGINRIGFSYSPDGNSIAWIRNFTGGYQELITKEFKTGKEKQLTFDKRTIDEVEWTNRGVILFSSSKGGNMNIWMIPEIGGEEVQVTKGNGPDMGIQFSTDPDKILYFQLTDFSHIWLNNLMSSELRQLTFDERLICNPAFSVDGKQLAFTVYNPSSELSPDNQIYITDRDGNNPRKLTSGNYRHSNSRFSPDGKFLAFTQAPVSGEEDKGSVFIVDLKSSEKPRYVSAGIVEMWANNNSLVVNRGHYTEITSIDGTSSKRISKDSTLAFPVASGKLMFNFDLHKETLGKAFVTSSDDKKLNAPLYTHTFSDIDTFQTIVNRVFTQNYFYWLNKKSEVWRFHFLSGKLEKVGNFPNIANLWGLGFNISYDDKEILHIEYQHRGKLVMIEDPFIN